MTMSDLISRQGAIDALAKEMPSLTTPDGSGEFDHDIQIADEAFVDCMQIINELPSAEPKTGEWVLDPNGMDWNIPAWRCSECGFVANYIGVEANGLGNNPLNWAGSKFCPQCGARMLGEDGEA